MFVTSPSPENLHTLFEFVFKGFDALEFQVCTIIIINIYVTTAFNRVSMFVIIIIILIIISHHHIIIVIVK